MATQHTPKPWLAVPMTSAIPGPAWVTADEGRVIVCTVGVDGGVAPPDFDVVAANAYLVAAGPDLLAACEEYIAYREGAAIIVDDIAYRMKAAIAKARGL